MLPSRVSLHMQPGRSSSCKSAGVRLLAQRGDGTPEACGTSMHLHKFVMSYNNCTVFLDEQMT